MDSAHATPRTEYCMAVTRLGEHQLIGYARLATEPQQAATIGFALHPAEWRKGLGTETVHLLCALGFTVLGMHRIWAARSPRNEASARTLLRAGLTEDGRIRDLVRAFPSVAGLTAGWIYQFGSSLWWHPLMDRGVPLSTAASSLEEAAVARSR
ncbi:GNAT family N-acetyltransferase [Kitasatospora sp. NPDC001132]